MGDGGRRGNNAETARLLLSGRRDGTDMVDLQATAQLLPKQKM